MSAISSLNSASANANAVARSEELWQAAMSSQVPAVRTVLEKTTGQFVEKAARDAGSASALSARKPLNDEDKTRLAEIVKSDIHGDLKTYLTVACHDKRLLEKCTGFTPASGGEFAALKGAAGELLKKLGADGYQKLVQNLSSTPGAIDPGGLHLPDQMLVAATDRALKDFDVADFNVEVKRRNNWLDDSDFRSDHPTWDDAWAEVSKAAMSASWQKQKAEKPSYDFALTFLKKLAEKEGAPGDAGKRAAVVADQSAQAKHGAADPPVKQAQPQVQAEETLSKEILEEIEQTRLEKIAELKESRGELGQRTQKMADKLAKAFELLEKNGGAGATGLDPAILPLVGKHYGVLEQKMDAIERIEKEDLTKNEHMAALKNAHSAAFHEVRILDNLAETVHDHAARQAHDRSAAQPGSLNEQWAQGSEFVPPKDKVAATPAEAKSCQKEMGELKAKIAAVDASESMFYGHGLSRASENEHLRQYSEATRKLEKLELTCPASSVPAASSAPSTAATPLGTKRDETVYVRMDVEIQYSSDKTWRKASVRNAEIVEKKDFPEDFSASSTGVLSTIFSTAAGDDMESFMRHAERRINTTFAFLDSPEAFAYYSEPMNDPDSQIPNSSAIPMTAKVMNTMNHRGAYLVAVKPYRETFGPSDLPIAEGAEQIHEFAHIDKCGDGRNWDPDLGRLVNDTGPQANIDARKGAYARRDYKYGAGHGTELSKSDCQNSVSPRPEVNRARGHRASK